MDHAGGPLLVLAGPGTGKTTTLVEADRRPDRERAAPAPTRAGADLHPQGRRAAARPGHRPARAHHLDHDVLDVPLLRLRPDPALLTGRALRGPLRLLVRPEQDVVLRELLTDHPGVGAVAGLAAPGARHPRLRPGGAGGARPGPGEGARRRRAARARARRTTCRSSSPPGCSWSSTSPTSTQQSATDYSDLIRRAVIEAADHRDELRARFTPRLRRRVPGHRPRPGRAAAAARRRRRATSPSSATRTSRSTASAARRCAASSTSPTTSARRRRLAGRRGRAADDAPVRPAAAAGRPARRRPARPAGTIHEAARADFPAPVAETVPTATAGSRCSTFDTERAEAEHLADLLRRAHLEDGIPWDDMAVLVRSGRTSIPALRRSLGGAGVPVEVAGDDVPLVRDPAVLPLLDALRAVLNLDNDDPDHVDYIDPAPGRGAAARPARRARRQRRTPARPRRCGPARRRSAPRQARPRPSRELVRAAVVDARLPRRRVAGPGGRASRARSTPCCAVHAPSSTGGSPPRRCCGRSGRAPPGPSGCVARSRPGVARARRANRDLDASCALFDAAARAEEQRDHLGVAIPGHPGRPGDPGRHAGRARRPRGLRCGC